MKKAIGQTVRDLKREVNKKVLKVPGIEQKILDATSNEPWGPHGSAMAELAQASRNFHDYQLIMAVIWKRISDTGKKWRHVFKALTVLEYLVAHGSERVIDEIKEHAYQLSTLAHFQYIDSNGRDQGSNIRRKSQGLVALVSSKERIQEIRQKSQSAKDKYNGENRNRSYSGAGSYGDRDDSGYNGNKDGERTGYGRDDERYARDNFGEDRGRDSVDYQTRSRSQAVDGYSERSFDDDDNCSSRNGECGTSPTQVSSSSVPNPKSPSENTGEGPDNAVIGDVVASPKNEFDAFDEFDPRGSVSGAVPASSSPELDIFGLSAPDSVNPLAVVPATSATTNLEANLHSDSGSGTNFDTLSSANNTNLPSENPFGDPPFKAIPQENFPSQPQNFQVVTSFQPSGSSDSPNTLPSAVQKVDSFPDFDFGDALGGLTYAPVSVNGEPSSVNPPFLASELSGEQSSNDILDSILPRTGSAPPFSSQETQPALSTNMQTDEMYFLPPSDQSAPAAAQGFLSNSQTAQMNPFQFSGFSVPVPAQGSSMNAETAQMNPFHISGLSAPVGSKEASTSSDKYFLPSSGILASATSSRLPTNLQATQGSFLQSSGPSVPAASQGSATNMQISEMNIIQPAGLSAPAAPQGPQTNMQSAEMNFFQPPQPSASAVPPGQQAIMQQTHMNFFQPSVLSSPVASTAPTNMQATQFGDPNDMPSAHLNLGSQSTLSDPLASPCLPTNIQATQENFLQSSGPSVPVASQGSATNMQTSEVNILQPSGLSAPAAPQGPQTNMQSADLNFFQPPRPLALATPQGPQAIMQPGHMNFFQPSGFSAPMASTTPTNMQATQSGAPNDMQSAHLNLGSQSMLSDPLASQEAQAPTNMQATQPGVPANMQTTQSEASTNMQATQSGAPTNAQGTQSGAPTNPQGTQFGAPTNIQTANPSPVTQLMPSDPLGSQTAQPTGPTYMHVTGPPANMQTAHLNLDSQSTLSDPLGSQRAQAAAPNYMQATQSGAPANIQTSQPMLSDPFVSPATPASAGAPAKLPSKEKFEPKSTVWADTLSRGLVNFNISGPKTNPLDDIGVDFDAINRKEKRLEAKSFAPPVVSTITMGKAMGSGSGLGRAGTGGFAPPPNPMMGSGVTMGGMGMAGGGGMGMGMGMGNMGGGAGMGMGAGMNMGGYGTNMSQPPMGMHMGMGMGQGAPGQPPTGMQPQGPGMQPQGPGMPGSGYNPMMGMGGYGRQQPYGGGYR